MMMKIILAVIGAVVTAVIVVVTLVIVFLPIGENIVVQYTKMVPADAKTFCLVKGEAFEEGGIFPEPGSIPDYLDIEFDEIEYVASYGGLGLYVPNYGMLTIYSGDFDLQGVRTKLEQRLFDLGEYRGVEIWENAGYYGTKLVALLEGKIIDGDENSVKKCVDVITGRENSLYTNENAKTLVDKLRYADLVLLYLDPYVEYEGLQAFAVSGKMLNGGKWNLQGLWLFLGEDDARRAMNDIRSDAEEMFEEKGWEYEQLTTSQDGNIVEISAHEVFIGLLVTAYFYDENTRDPITYTSVEISTDAETWEYWGYTDKDGKIRRRLTHVDRTVYFKPSGYEHVSQYISLHERTYSFYCSRAGVELTAYFYDEATDEPITYTSVEISTDAVTWEYWGYTDENGKITDADFPYPGQTVYFRPSGYEHDSTYVSSYGGTEYLYCSRAGVELTAYFYDEATYEPITYTSVEISTDAVTWEYWGYTDENGKITDADFPYPGQTVYFRPSGYEHDSTYVSSYGGTEYLYCSAALEVGLVEALDTGLTIITGGDAHWFGQTGVSHDGVDAAQSGDIGHDQNTYFQTTVTGSGTLTFWWRVSSESGYDYLRFFIDGVEQDAISGETAWTQQSYSIGSGSHTLKWEYMKDGSVSSGSDCGWVDELVFT
jgi:YHS domain-containing protein